MEQLTEYKVENPEQFAKDLAGEIRRLAAENPDYVYVAEPSTKTYGNPTCYYTATDGHDACIFGKALANLGVPLEVLRKFDDRLNGPGTYLGVGITTVLAELGVPLIAGFSQVQRFQDKGVAWKQAIKALGVDPFFLGFDGTEGI